MVKNEQKLVEVARSFSYKLNTGNYQSVDFFASQKVECLENEASAKSEALYQWCKEQVMKAVYEFKQELADPMVEIKESVKQKPLPTVTQWENMSQEEQAFRKAVDLKNKRRSYHERKEAAQQSAELSVSEE